MKNQKLRIALVVAFGIFLVVALGWVVWGKNNYDFQQNKLASPAQQMDQGQMNENNLKKIGEDSSISIDTWKTYTNKDDGYSLKYPYNWESRSFDGTSFFVPSAKNDLYNPSDNIKGDYAIIIAIYRGIGANKTLNEWKPDSKDGQNIFSDVVIDNYPAIKVDNTYKKNNLMRTVNYFFIDKNNNGYNIRVLYRDSRDYVGDRIISTINFFDPTEDLNIYQNISSEEQLLNSINVKNITAESLVSGIYEAVFKSKNNLNPSIDAKDCVFWKRKDSINFGSSGWEARAARSDLSSINTDIEILKSFFIGNNFIENKENTFTNSKNDIMYTPGQTLGFEKGNLRCLVKWSELTSDQNTRNSIKDSFSVSCEEYTRQDEKNFQTFLPILETNSTVKTFCVKKQEGIFAWGSFSNSSWYSKKIDNQWKIVWSGQDYPQCSKIAGFPEEVYETCKDY